MAEFSTAARERLAAKGVALKDGSFPIRNVEDLENAIQAFGRAKNKAAAKRHIIKRARVLNALGKLPDSWKVAMSDPRVPVALSVPSVEPEVEPEAPPEGEPAPPAHKWAAEAEEVSEAVDRLLGWRP